MTFAEAVRAGFSRYANASGRAPRSEYWYWTLFNVLVSLLAMVPDYVLFPNNSLQPITTIAGLALLLPSWAVAIRRLHDVNRSGYWLLIAFTGIGILLILYWACIRGTEGDNAYGADPLTLS
jgi:uncharacterized membrane protein YhaH (DUF805 family)